VNLIGISEAAYKTSLSFTAEDHTVQSPHEASSEVELCSKTRQTPAQSLHSPMAQLSWTSPAKFVKNDPQPEISFAKQSKNLSSALAETNEEPQYGWEGVFTPSTRST